jgi:hypothetical protein
MRYAINYTHVLLVAIARQTMENFYKFPIAELTTVLNICYVLDWLSAFTFVFKYEHFAYYWLSNLFYGCSDLCSAKRGVGLKRY